jgi:hypothetical protein
VPVENVLDAYVNFEGAVALTRVLIDIRHELIRNAGIVPLVNRGIYLVTVWNGPSELYFGAIDVVTPVQVVVAHPLQEILQMTLIWLEHLVQDCSLVQKIGETGHVHRIEHVDFQKGLVPNVVPKEGHAFDKRDVTDIKRLSIVCVAAVGVGEGMVNRGTKIEDVGVN